MPQFLDLIRPFAQGNTTETITFAVFVKHYKNGLN